MESMTEEKKYLVSDIKEMKNGSVEQMALVTYYSLGNYFKALLAFGRKSHVTKDNLRVIKEMYHILRKENALLNFILRNVDTIDVEAASAVVEMLDSLNDKTVEYYYDVIEDVEDACECKEERRGIRPKKNFPTLTQSDSYAREVIALGEDLDSLKSFLDYEPEFWTFIKPYFKTANVNLGTMSGMFYVAPIYEENGTVCGVDLLVPQVVDLKSALLAIKLYEKAYHIYEARGKTYKRPDKQEQSDLPRQYEEEFLQDKLNLVFNKKDVK